MYKDKDKQREANRQAKERWKAKWGDIAAREALGIPKEGIPEKGIPPIERIPKPEHTTQGNIRVCKPGDDDYVPQCETTRAFIEGRDKRPETAKEIKTFADLPPGIQQTINTLSDDKTEHKRRTAIAINYQHQFPDRFHSTGI